MINPSILLQGRPAQINDPTETAQRMISLQEMMQAAPIQQELRQNQLRASQMQIQDRERDLAREAEFIAGVKAGKTSTDLMGVDPTRAMGMRKGEAELAKTNLETQAAQVKLHKDRAERLSSIGVGISDQTSYVNGIHQAVREGLIPTDVAMKLPAKFDPAMVSQFVRSALSAKDARELELKDLDEKRQAEMHPQQMAKATADAQLATLTAAGKEPIQPFQNATLTQTKTRDADNARHDRVMESAAMLRARNTKAGAPADPALVQAVIDNPQLLNRLTPTAIGSIAPELAKHGFSAFGRPLSESAIAKLSESDSAVTELKGLKEILTKNSQYLGPIAGWQALNPWSDARKAQADIDRVKQRIGKALEGGVLRKEDEEKYKKILATLLDTPDTANYKIDQLIATIEGDKENFKAQQMYAGREVNGPGAPPAGSPGAGMKFKGVQGDPASMKTDEILRRLANGGK